MKKQEILNIMCESIQKNKELEDLVRSCYKEMFKDDPSLLAYALCILEEDLEDGMESFGCLRGWECVRENWENGVNKAKKLEDGEL